jgi:predicted phosphate transport protein (TIGR00153 family)
MRFDGGIHMVDHKHYRSTIIDTLPTSPIKVLMEHFDRCCQAVHKLNDMLFLYMDGEYTEAATVSVEISRLEHEADEIKRHLRANVPRMILMPISRGDLLEILASNERIADSAQDVAQILDMRETEIPEDLRPLIEEFMGNIVEAVLALRRMMNHLERLLESTFAKLETHTVLELGHDVHEHEYKADRAGKELAKAIYGLEDQLSPVAIYHMMRFTIVLDRVADNAENAALKMVQIVSK